MTTRAAADWRRIAELEVQAAEFLAAAAECQAQASELRGYGDIAAAHRAEAVAYVQLAARWQRMADETTEPTVELEIERALTVNEALS